ncbi:MAG: PfkB family carbohydrate kinase [Polyangia bacterium]|jgi:sugar/nucleoside kinase (ribokinase family)|nr:PfkB family carbohydrate kinase [Polyangia bacterium]
MSLVVVGSVALDTVETASATRERILGGAACFVSLAAAHFTSVRLVGIIGEDFPEEHLELLERRQIDCAGLSRAAGKTFFWHGRYAPDFSSRESIVTELGVFADFHPELPPAYREAQTLFLANIHPALQSHVCRQMTRPRLIAADTMDFWIRGEPRALAETLSFVHLLTINDEEVRLLAGEHNIVKAARAVLRMGPRALVVKRGEHGALLFTGAGPEDIFALPAIPLTHVVDPTGAGDTFAGGMMGYLDSAPDVDVAALRLGVAYGTAAASFTVSDFSLDGLQLASRALLDERVAALVELTRF